VVEQVGEEPLSGQLLGVVSDGGDAAVGTHDTAPPGGTAIGSDPAGTSTVRADDALVFVRPFLERYRSSAAARREATGPPENRHIKQTA